MATPASPAPTGAPVHIPSASPAEPTGRSWGLDEIVVAAFAFLGVVGSVFLIVYFGVNAVPSILVSFLLATGLAALTYRFLGGIDAGTSFRVGALKLTGSLAALVGIALVVNHYLADQVKQVPVRYLRAQVYGAHNSPLPDLTSADVVVFTPTDAQAEQLGFFSVEYLDESSLPRSRETFLTLNHKGYASITLALTPSKLLALYPTAKIKGTEIEIGQIKIDPQPSISSPPQVPPAQPQALAPGQMSSYTAPTQSAPMVPANYGGAVPK